jgi:RNA polymerase subunit RPABC4/transcription elongation factor Spt4
MDQDAAIRLGAFIGGLWLFLIWLGIVLWVFRDIRDRTEAVVPRLLSVALVVLFFPGFNLPGLLLYLLLRPRESLDEAYSRSLEQEALLREVGEGAVCYECRQPVEREFLFCPYCRARLREPCERCRRPLSLFWAICPYCGTPRGMEPRAPSHRAPASLVEPISQADD